MATNTVRDIVVDNLFPIPPGMVDMRYENKEDGEFNYINEDDIADSAPILDAPDSTVPTLPLASFKIVDQTIRITSDGRSVVDVTFEFPDVNGILSVEMRVTKL